MRPFVHLGWAVCVLLLLLPAQVAGQPIPSSAHAVVQIPSHGGSGTVVFTWPGRTLVLTCAHLWGGAADQARRPVIMAPSPTTPGGPRRVGTRLLTIDRRNDLALILLPDGPLPYVAPVPIGSYQPDRVCWSVGYDEMRRPPQVRPARIVAVEDGRYLTDTRPWHGRSGGALLEARTGYLIGVVTAYRGQKGPRGPRGPLGSDPLFEQWEKHPSGRGVAVALHTVARFLAPHLGGKDYARSPLSGAAGVGGRADRGAGPADAAHPGGMAGMLRPGRAVQPALRGSRPSAGPRPADGPGGH